jgi:holo-[acyl-carrier protein] synthase
MITGTGVDIVAVERLALLWQRYGQRLVAKLLHPDEYLACEQSRDKPRFLAKRFAAKEAFAKALGTGFRGPLTLPRLQVSHDALGKPTLACDACLAPLLHSRQVDRIHLSLSDEQQHCIAFVILESCPASPL